MRLHADGGSTETLWSYSRIVVVAVVVRRRSNSSDARGCFALGSAFAPSLSATRAVNRNSVGAGLGLRVHGEIGL